MHVQNFTTTLLQTGLIVFLQAVLQRPNRRNVWRCWFRSIRSIQIAWKPLWYACVWHEDVMEEHFWNVSCGTNPTKKSIQTSQCFNTAVEFTVSLQTSSHGLQPWFFLLNAAPLNSSYGVEVWRPSINCRLDYVSKSWTQFSSISIYASSRGRLLSYPLSAFVSVGAPKQHWLLNALAFQQLPLLCLDWQIGCNIIHLLCDGSCSSNHRMSSITEGQGWLLRICHVLFLLLLVLPSSTVPSPYAYGQIFLDTSWLLTCCFNRCTATVYCTRTICKYSNPAAENCCFHVSTASVYGLPFPNKACNKSANKGLVHYCTHTSTWCQQLYISCNATF